MDAKEEHEIFYNTKTNKYAEDLVSGAIRCSKVQPNPCENHNKDVSSTLIEAMGQLTYMQYTTDHVKLTVYPTTLDVKTEVTTPKYDWVGFLSNIGGVMGLFTGFSILSFLEIVELVFDLVVYTLAWMCRKEKKSTSMSP